MERIYLRILLAIALALMCVLVSCGYVGRSGSTGNSVPLEKQSEPAVLDRNFKIKYGQELTVEGQNLKLKFGALLDDSRCPTDMKCLWQGDARILISVRGAQAEASELELHTNEHFTQALEYQRYVIKLVALDPYPRTSARATQSDYVATLLIKKL